MPAEIYQMEGEHPMALMNCIAASVEPKPSILLFHKRKKPLLFNSNCSFSHCSPHFTISAQSGGGAAAGGGGGVTEEESPPSLSSPGSSSPSPTARAQAQLDLLEQLTSTAAASSSAAVDGRCESEGGAGTGGLGKGTIRDQLLRLVREQDGDFSIQLGKENLKKVSAKFLTISQKRNIRRQAYLDQVSQRNDSAFFATIGAFVILPPLVILGVAVLTGYVQPFP